ncbi:MAG TPA: heme biosynthesis HemY N-terminal domain-containing protein [Steroidobacteraceae bacterium]|nr:heme biosynthesis HemY N-terminal domain-containing protein [Steroidobacteraceae bacterium]
MRRGVYLILALLAGALIASALRLDAGYVAISFLGVLIEMSVITLVLLILAAYFALWLLVRLFRARKLRREAQAARRQQRARNDLARGVFELAEGNWPTAEITLTRSARENAQPAVNYLIAARAADLQGAHERRAGWLRMAREAAPEEVAPVLVTQAEIQLKYKQLDAARDTLQELDTSGHQNPRGLLLLARLYRHLGQFEKLRALEPKLRGARRIRPAAVDELMDQAYLEMLRVAAESGDPARLERAWNDASKPATRRPDIVLAYAQGAMKCRDHETAEQVLRESLDHAWSEQLAAAYGELELPESLEPLGVAEKWLRSRREDPVLLVTCARLSIRAELYGKARSYLETSLAIRRHPETYQILGQLLEQLGEKERAAQVLREGLALAIGHGTDMPKIKPRRFQARADSDSARR